MELHFIHGRGRQAGPEVISRGCPIRALAEKPDHAFLESERSDDCRTTRVPDTSSHADTVPPVLAVPVRRMDRRVPNSGTKPRLGNERVMHYSEHIERDRYKNVGLGLFDRGQKDHRNSGGMGLGENATAPAPSCRETGAVNRVVRRVSRPCVRSSQGN